MKIKNVIKQEIHKINEAGYYFNRSLGGDMTDLYKDLESYDRHIGDANEAETDDITKRSLERASYTLEIFEDVFESMLDDEQYDYFAYEENFAGRDVTLDGTKLFAQKLSKALKSFLEKVNERGTENMDGDLKKILRNIYLIQFMIYNLPEETEEE